MLSVSKMNLSIVMSSGEQKQSLVKDCNKQLQVYWLTVPLKVPITGKTMYTTLDWLYTALD